jgi:hypothetical protein
MEQCNNCSHNSNLSCNGNRICVSSASTSNAINITNNKARYYAELAEMYKNEAQEFRDSAQYYAEQNSDVTMEYVNQQDDALENLIDGKQSVLVSGTNIKTINSASILDSGNLTLADQDLSNLSSVGQDIIDGKADTDLSNLTTTASPNFDGQWVDSLLTLASSGTTAPTSDINYDLSSYLPNDGHNYEVLIAGRATTDSTSGNTVILFVHSSILTTDIYITQAITRTSSTMSARGSVILPIGTNRILTLAGISGNAGTFGLYLVGYRRIGTNS